MDTLTHSGSTGALSKAGLAEGTNSATIKTNAPNGAGTDYAIKGTAYHKADTDNIAMTALAVQADLTTCVYLVQIDTSGTVSMKKGTEVTSTTLGVTNVCQVPMHDDGCCPLGHIKVVLSGATFTSGTTDLSASGVTATFVDYALGYPSAPVSS